MACTPNELSFQPYQSLVITIQRTGDKVLLYLENQGENVLLIERILLSYVGTGAGTLFLRVPPNGISWIYPSAYLEQGLMALYYDTTFPGLTSVQAQAEYTEIDGRSRSCTY